jgi:hypothetical protein
MIQHFGGHLAMNGTFLIRNPRQRECQRGLRAGQYSLGKWMTLLVKYRVISSSGKSVCSISLVNMMLPLPSSHLGASRKEAHRDEDDAKRRGQGAAGRHMEKRDGSR